MNDTGYMALLTATACCREECCPQRWGGGGGGGAFSLWSVVPFFSVECGTCFLCGMLYPLSVEAGYSVEEEVSFIKGTGNLPSFSSGKTLEFR